MNSFRKAFFLTLILSLPFVALMLPSEINLLSLVWTETEQPLSVVKIIVESRNTMDFGSGCLIRGDMILTADHVVRDYLPGDKLSIEFRDGLIREGYIIKTDSIWDLAAIGIKPVLYPVARPAVKPVIKGQTVKICGFPHGADFHQVRGKVSGFRSPKRNGPDYIFVANQRVIEGMSGGPVFNDGGEVVGILWGNRRFAHCTGLEAIRNFLEELQ